MNNFLRTATHEAEDPRVESILRIVDKHMAGEPISELERTLFNLPQNKKLIRERERFLQKDVRDRERKLGDLEALRDFYRRSAKAVSTSTTDAPQSSPASILDVRKHLQRDLATLDRLNAATSHSHWPPVIEELWSSHWFDFRSVDVLDREMIAGARRAIEEGLIRSPYSGCIFMLPCKNYAGRGTALAIVSDDSGRPKAFTYFVCVRGSTTGLTFVEDFDTGPLDEMIIGCLALLSSSAAERTERKFSGEIAEPGERGNHSVTYSEVTIGRYLVSRGAAMGERKRPRLHWRRGHIRTYKTGDRLWIGPTLVGRAESGIAIKDYRVKNPQC